MEIFWRLILAHFIADFTLQTNYIAAWKRRNQTGMFVHCAIHPLLYLIFLWRYADQVWIEAGPLRLTGYLCIFLIFAVHYVEDEWRVWSVLKKGAPDNTFFYLWDQVIHYAVIFAMSPVVDGSASKFGYLNYPAIAGIVPLEEAGALGMVERFFTITRPERWVFVAILFVVVTHFTTVSIYFVEKDFFRLDYPGSREKYIGMAERLLVAACFLLPGFWWLGVVAVWILRSVLYKMWRVENPTWPGLLIGNAAAVLCGFLSRIVIYA